MLELVPSNIQPAIYIDYSRRCVYCKLVTNLCTNCVDGGTRSCTNSVDGGRGLLLCSTYRTVVPSAPKKLSSEDPKELCPESTCNTTRARPHPHTPCITTDDPPLCHHHPRGHVKHLHVVDRTCRARDGMQWLALCGQLEILWSYLWPVLRTSEF